MHACMAGQLRLTEGEEYVPNIKPRSPTTLEPVVARLGINTKMEKPALLHKSENDHKKPEKIFFPPSASQPRKFTLIFFCFKCFGVFWNPSQLHFECVRRRCENIQWFYLLLSFANCFRIQSTLHKSFQA